ncbi:hypothetical protein ACPOL_2614 [Acidisarcina polymorpha]|uniref:Uncharacterized protein n=1 Tax=Acidisarcina polymorpha TaxID=2211140 RepID=A0A2Z5FYZ3_9BACT|nr:hypothetical protein ACPOL_2614 [Acidisarcina polymorpha]
MKHASMHMRGCLVGFSFWIALLLIATSNPLLQASAISRPAD